MAISLVQSAGNRDTSGSVSSLTVTFSAAGAGNLLLLSADVNTTLANLGNPSGWTVAVGAQDTSTTISGKIWYKVAAGGETSAVITIPSGFVIAAEMGEFTGLATWAIDKTATNDPVGTGTTCQTGSTGTLSSAAQVAWAAVTVDTQQSSRSWDSGFTSVSHFNSYEVAGYLITAATTALNPTATYGTSAQRNGMIATFQIGAVPVNVNFTGKQNVNAAVNKSFTGKQNVGGRVNKSFTGKQNVGGPVGTFTPRTEVAWTTDPLTRPGALDWSQLSDVTDGIRNIDIKRGTKIRSAQIEAGTATAVVDNSARKLDPSNVASPLYPNVQPRKRIRYIVNAGGADYVLHTGFAERWPIEWSQESGWVTISSSDLFGLLAGATLPPSVLDVETRALAPTNYWPMSETIFTGTADDVVGVRDGIYLGAVQTGQQIVAFDPRPCPKFPAPMVANQVTPAMVVNPITCPSAFSISFWFQWEVAGAVSANPTLVMFQASNPPDIPSGGFTSPQSIGLFLTSDSTFTDRKNFRVFVTDGTHQARTTAPVAYNLLDGNPHHIVWTVDCAAKTFKVVVDNGSQVSVTTDTGDAGTTPLASVNVASVGAAQTTLSLGWGIDYQTAVTSQTSAALGQLVLWDRQITTLEIAALYQAGTVAWSGDTTGARVNRVLDALGVDALDRDIATGSQTLGPTLLGSQNGLGYLRKINATEGGVCYVSGDGKITFRARDDIPTVIQTFSDDPTGDDGAPYGPIRPDYSYDRIINTATIGRENGADQTVTNDSSIAAYGPLSGPLGGKLDTLAQDADQARALGLRLTEKYGDPKTYIPTVEIEAIDTAVTLDAMVNVDIGDGTEVFARPAGGGAAIDQMSVVEALNHKFPGYGQWTVSYSLVEIAPPDVSDGESATTVPTDISDGESSTVVPTDISDGGHS